MKCPQCGHENPDNELFCEECDFRMDQKVPKRSSMDKQTMSIYIGFGALVFGIASVLSLMLNSGIFAVIFGAIGMIAGGYGISLVRFSGIPKNVKTAMIIIVAIAIIASVVGFLRGFVMLF